MAVIIYINIFITISEINKSWIEYSWIFIELQASKTIDCL